jgi:hypothetical protein
LAAFPLFLATKIIFGTFDRETKLFSLKTFDFELAVLTHYVIFLKLAVLTL